MAAVYTKRNGAVPPAADAHPAVRYLKWQAYDRLGGNADDKQLDTKASRRTFLDAVAKGVELDAAYRQWHGQFVRSIREATIGRELRSVSWQSEWRLVIGWSTNPTLEGGGLALHPIWGFPQLPGSGVRGLVKAVAEGELLASSADGPGFPEAPSQLPLVPPVDLVGAISRAERVWVVFGSLSATSGDVGPETALDRIERWIALVPPIDPPAAWADTIGRLRRLSGSQNLQGLLTCFDAVPAPPAEGATIQPLELDVLTPHYKKYYDSLQPGKTPVDPSDDDGPNPVNFLVIKPGIRFEFRWALGWPATTSLDDAAQERRSVLKGLTVADLQARVFRWLTIGLSGLGLGAKTSAGYGYFQLPRTVNDEPPEPRPDPRQYPRRNPNARRRLS